jgi:hypothetical protein
LINNSKVALGMSLVPAASFSMKNKINIKKLKSNRPPLNERTFTSKAVEKTINKAKASIADPELAWDVRKLLSKYLRHNRRL